MDFRTTPSRDFELLLAVALAQPIALTRLVKLCQALRLRVDDEQGCSSDSLKTKLTSLGRDCSVRLLGDGYALSPEHQTLVFREAARRGTLAEVVPVVRGLLDAHSYYASRNPRTALFEFYVAFHLEQYSEAHDKLMLCAELAPAWYAALAPLYQVVCMPFEVEALDRLPPGVLGWVLPLLLQRALRAGTCPAGLYQWLCAADERLTHEALCWLGDLAFLRADVPTLQRTETLVHRSMERHRQEGMRSFLAGDVAQARSSLDRFCEALRGHSKRRVVPADGLAGVCHVLALLASPDPDDEVFAQRYTAVALRDRDIIFAGAFAVLKNVVARALDERVSVVTPAAVATEQDCLSALLHGLSLIWFPSTALERRHGAAILRARIATLDPALAWLRAQYVSVLERLLKELEEDDSAAALPRVALTIPLHPIVDLLSQEPDWALALATLSRLSEAVQEPVQEDERRIIWVVTPTTLELHPYLQRRKGFGAWSSGKKLPLKHLLPGGDAYELLTEEDRRVLEHLTTSENASSRRPRVGPHLPRAALAALVGHTHVFTAGDTETPLDVIRGHVSIRVREHEGALVVETEPPAIDSEVLVEFSLRRMTVFSLSEEQFRMVRVLGQRLQIPASGKAQAAKVLAQLTGAFVVQGDSPGEGRLVKADPTPWLRLVPSGTEISVQATVRPLGPHGPILVPGEGGKVVSARVAGELLEADRDLNEELERIDRLEVTCPTLSEAHVGGCEWVVEGVENSLALLAELKELSSEVVAEWPRGRGALKVRGKVGLGALSGRVERERGWYVATAELAVDDATQLQLQELLNLHEQSSGRFVALEDGGYLELEQELREMLAALSAARDSGRKDHRVAVATSALNVLSYFGGERSALEGDEAVRTLQARVKEAFARRFSPPPGLRATLREYQQEGFEWLCRLAQLRFGACLADDMGLGKTVQLIALMLHEREHGPALVVAPTSVCSNWRDEIERFADGLSVLEYQGPERARLLDRLGPGVVLICSYTLLQQDIDELSRHAFHIAVLDEAQFIKNPQSRRAKAAFTIDAPVRIAATGTPVENHLGDLWSLFHFINPGLLHSWPQFSRRFVLPIETKQSQEARAGLRRLVQPFLLRRTKAQVLSELPPLTEVTLHVPLSQEEKELYEACKRQALSKLQSTARERREDPRRRFRVLAEITRLRRLCCDPSLVLPETHAVSSKLTAFLELVQELIDGGHRALVFSQFVDVLALAEQRLNETQIEYEYLDGSTPAKERRKRVAAFQEGSAPVFLISLKAGGFGLNLTAADYVIHLDPWWNPAAESQASDRAHRLGQERPVTVYRLIAKDTVEDRILALHERKRELADALLSDSDRASRLSEDELLELFG